MEKLLDAKIAKLKSELQQFIEQANKIILRYEGGIAALEELKSELVAQEMERQNDTGTG